MSKRNKFLTDFCSHYTTECENDYVKTTLYQLTHTTLKNVELLKHSKISKTAPTCCGLQGNHHQGATVST